MWIVRLALRRPYTFVVMSILILLMGGLAIFRTPRFCDSRFIDRVRWRAPADGAKTGNQRMANAGSPGPARHLLAGIS